MAVVTPQYKTTDAVDFVVVGSGAAGGVLAKELGLPPTEPQWGRQFKRALRDFPRTCTC